MKSRLRPLKRLLPRSEEKVLIRLWPRHAAVSVAVKRALRQWGQCGAVVEYLYGGRVFCVVPDVKMEDAT